MTRPELLRALGALQEPAPSSRLAALVGLPVPGGPDRYAEVFLFETHPFASVHLGSEGMIGGDALDRVAGFFRVLGLSPPAEPDSLSRLLDLYVRLGDAETDAAPRHREAIASARRALYFEHLAPWVFVHLRSVERLGVPFYGSWAALLAEALADEAAGLAAPAALPLALRSAPAPLGDDPRTRLVEAATAPVRSGMVLTRADLARAGRELGLAVRRGERRYILGALLDQDPHAVWSWLAAHARDWATLHPHLHAGRLEPVGTWWADRAERAAEAFARAAAA